MAQSADDKKVKTLAEMTSMNRLNCTSPDRELFVEPRWIVFHSEGGQFKSPMYVKLFIENRETYRVTYAIKAREKIFRIDFSYGILDAGERRLIKLFLTPSDDWPLGVDDYKQKRLKVAVESLKIPSEIHPKDGKEAFQMAKNIWKRSFNDWPMERICTKVNVTLITTPLTSSNPSAPIEPVPTAVV